jgi:hypothetical protein
MPRHKSDEWISGNEATDILSKNSGRPITSAYLRLIARQGKIRWRAMDGRTNEYYRPDVEKYKVKARSKEQRETIGKSEEVA